MATNKKLFNEYRETQKGMNTGLRYDEWLEDKVNELRKQVKLFAIPDVISSVCDHPEEALIRDNPTEYCMACGKNIPEQTDL